MHPHRALLALNGLPLSALRVSSAAADARELVDLTGRLPARGNGNDIGGNGTTNGNGNADDSGSGSGSGVGDGVGGVVTSSVASSSMATHEWDSYDTVMARAEVHDEDDDDDDDSINNKSNEALTNGNNGNIDTDGDVFDDDFNALRLPGKCVCSV
jgi:hypothetical protein